MNPIKIGITGGIGSGKTVVSQILELAGIPVYFSDIEAKRLTINDHEIRRQLIALLGAEVYLDNNEINKPLLSSYLFSNPEHAQTINNIIHPEVRKDFRQWVQRHSTCPMVGMESAILIEAGFKSEVDYLVLVYAPMDLRIQRTIQRDNSTHEAVSQRVAQQMSDEQKKEEADFIIYNDDLAPLIPQVTSLLDKLSLHSND